ncbi:Na(+)/H(+) antiporter subunit B [Dehalobacterium formicoaceticum]|uniref:Na(+)/H(+) antiporter subunit B n=1 Tax=Dehalobacterium formicoaceticum TaxID=51515 RepID=A0ABT1Y2D7_9FIRM|nr:Na(+)/H(+) antiporter subunit B [Dehalobacterium formicoaceticum]MCR6544345.1 Na(+)/H(+) antiporter subunit B [Dehalobacterium formicoaceticum]
MKHHEDMILQTVAKIAAFIILTVAVYLFWGGHHQPGGGFVGGLIVSSAVILMYLAFDLKSVLAGISFDFKILAPIGVSIAMVTGMIPMFMGRPFLSQAFGYFDLPIFGETELASAVLFDTGVALAVIGTALTIITAISEDECTWKH